MTRAWVVIKSSSEVQVETAMPCRSDTVGPQRGSTAAKDVISFLAAFCRIFMMAGLAEASVVFLDQPEKVKLSEMLDLCLGVSEP